MRPSSSAAPSFYAAIGVHRLQIIGIFPALYTLRQRRAIGPNGFTESTNRRNRLPTSYCCPRFLCYRSPRYSSSIGLTGATPGGPYHLLEHSHDISLHFCQWLLYPCQCPLLQSRPGWQRPAIAGRGAGTLRRLRSAGGRRHGPLRPQRCGYLRRRCRRRIVDAEGDGNGLERSLPRPSRPHRTQLGVRNP